MATIKEIKRELRYREWAEEIAECQSSGMKISEWCQKKGISCNTYYRRLRIVRNEFLERSEAPLREIVPLSISPDAAEWSGSLLFFSSVVIVRIDGEDENVNIRSQASSTFFFP